MHQGVQKAETLGSDYLWLADADIRHAPDSLSQLLHKAETEDLAMASLMVQLRCESPWERLLIPAFIFFFQKLYPFPWVNQARSRMAGAAGGCILIRHQVLSDIGGLEILREALIDDCTLAAKIKGVGGLGLGSFLSPQQPQRAIWLGLGPETLSLRPYDTLESIWSMVARTAYTQLRYSPWLLAGTILGMTLVYLIAPLGLLASLGVIASGMAIGHSPWGLGPATAMVCGTTWSLMAIAYSPTLRLYRQPWYYAWALPAIAFLYTLMTLDSARRHWQGKGGAWKGRTYAS
jgi:hopene-associated glycosyltransferase HpnB